MSLLGLAALFALAVSGCAGTSGTAGDDASLARQMFVAGFETHSLAVELLADPVVGYSLAYPFGVVGMIVAVAVALAIAGVQLQNVALVAWTAILASHRRQR